jgi:type I restriction-modification system DNA methylase subunit
LKYINTRSANTNACKKLTSNSIAITIIGVKNGTFIAAIVPATIRVKSTTHANIFQNNLSVSDNTFVNSPINSRNHINKPNNISNILTISHKGSFAKLSGFSQAIPKPFKGIYLSIK